MTELMERFEREVARASFSANGFTRTLARVRRRERRRRLIAGALALILALGGIAVAWEALNPNHDEPSRPSDPFKLAANTQAAVGEGSVWFLSCDRCSDPEVTTARARGRLLRVDPATRRLVASIPIENPGEMAVGDGAVWITNFTANTVTRVDTSTNRVVATIPLTLPFEVASGDHQFLPLNIAVGEGFVWVDTARGAVARIDPRTNRVGSTIDLKGADFVGELVVGEEAVWVDSGAEGVTRLDPHGGQVVGTVPAYRSGRDLLTASYFAPGGGLVWATGAWARWSDQQGDLVATDPPEWVLMRIDPATDRIQPLADLGNGGWPVAFGGGSVWVVSGSEVLRIDADTGRVADSVGLPSGAWLVPADDGGAPWLAGRDGSLTRVDSLVDQSPPASPQPKTAFIPRTHGEGDSIVMPVTFPDGTKAEIVFPSEVDLAGMGVQPDVSFLWLAYPPPRYPLSFYHGDPDPSLFEGIAPVRRYETRGGGRVELWQAAEGSSDSGDYWLWFRFGAWTILAPADLESAEDVAHALDGHVTSDGFVVIDAHPPMGLSEEQGEGGGPALTFGDLDPRPYHTRTDTPRLVILWPLRAGCKDEHSTRTADYASTCLEGSIFVSIYGEPTFLDAMTKGLRAQNVHLAS